MEIRNLFPSSILKPAIAIEVSVCLIILWIVALVVYNKVFHPLAKYPGPFLWTTFRWPYVRSLLRGNLVHDIRTIHEQHGRIVRVAPNELSYVDAQAWKDIYGHQQRRGPEFPKNPIWTHKSPNGAKSIIDADYEAHKRMRRPLLNAFSPRALRDQEPLMQHYLDNLVTQLDALVCAGKGNAVVNLQDYFNWTTFDIIGDLGFGEPFDCLKNGKYHPWVSYLFGHLKSGALRAAANHYPPIAAAMLWLTPQEAFQRRQEHFNMSCDKLRRRMALNTTRRDLISYILQAHDGENMSLKELQATTALLILAGSESTSTCLTATTNLLLRYPEKLQKLNHEIRSRFITADEISYLVVQELPYLKACFQEGLRMAPPVPIGIPRIVPSTGATVCGDFLPPGTFVAVPQYAAYRFEDNFKLPDRFIPERWLSGESQLQRPTTSDPDFGKDRFVHDAKNVLQPFSVGPRDCVGKELGIMEMRLVLTHVLWHFDLEIPDPVTLPGGAHAFHEFEKQKTFALWERLPMNVKVTKRAVKAPN